MTLNFPSMCSLPVPMAPARACTEIDMQRFSNRRDTSALLAEGIAPRQDLRAEVAA